MCNSACFSYYVYRTPTLSDQGSVLGGFPFRFLVSRRADYPEVSHTCWHNAVISDTGSSCETLTLSPSHSTLSVARVIRLYHNVDMDNRNMSMERWKYNL
jgi:hypothetical protein